MRLLYLALLSLVLATSAAAANGVARGVPHPVWFEENTGQAEADVAYIGHGFSRPVAILRDGSLTVEEAHGTVTIAPHRPGSAPEVYGVAPTGGVTQSYLPEGTFRARHFAEVRIANAWPGISAYYRLHGNELELGLDVIPLQRPGLAAFRCIGGKARVDKDGGLTIRSREDRFTLRAPIAFQPDNEAPIEARWRVARDGTFGFEVPDAVRHLSLNIDPVFDLSTYIGGSQSDSINAMEVGADGSIYLAGQTASTRLLGRNTGTAGGSGKAMVLRLSPGAASVMYATVIAGSNNDLAKAIAIDSTGAAYVTGQTNSTNFPTLNAYLSTAPTDWNAFALKLNASGTLVYSTYLGGSGADWGYAVAVNASGQAVVAGQTASSDFPVTASAYQRIFGGAQDCFVSGLSADGKSLVFSTLLGGIDLDNCTAVAYTSSGAIAVAGSTRSSNFPVLGPFQSLNGGFLDGFVAQLNSTASSLLSASYLGGIGEDQVSAMALDSSGYTYVAGTTSSTTGFPGTSGGVITKVGNGRKGFACKIAPSLVSVNWCSIVGGSGDDYALAMALSSNGKLVIGGQTTSLNLPVVNAAQSTFQGAQDGWFAVLSATGTQWETVSYTGGAATNSVNAVRTLQDRVLLAGSTTASNLTTTAGALQSTSGGGGDGFLQEIALSSGLSLSGLTPSSGSGLSHTITAAVTDTAGASAIQTIQVVVGDGSTLSNACVVAFAPISLTVSLLNDAGTASIGTATVGSSTVLQNSQCLLSASTTSVTQSGNAISVQLTLTYKSAFATTGGGANKYVGVTAADNQSKTLSALQSATWTVATGQPPTVVSVTPSSGSGTSRSFVIVTADPAGAVNMSTVQVLFNTSTSLTNACSLTYNASSSTITLLNDAGSANAGTLTLGTSSTISNTQCALAGTGTSVSSSGNNVTLTLNLTFTTAFASSGGNNMKTIYVKPTNASGLSAAAGLASYGTWTLPAPAGPPSVTGISPSSGQGGLQAFTISVSDSVGASDIASVQLLVNTSTATANACVVTYTAATGTLALANDAGTGVAGAVTLGQSTSASNTQCTVMGAGSSVVNSGTSMTLVIKLGFNISFASIGGGATKLMYVKATNAASQSAGYVTAGTWAIPTTASGPPTLVSVTPSAGQGTAQGFVIVVDDPVGATDLASVQFLMSTSTSAAAACAVTYSSAQNLLTLADDAGTGAAGAVTPGQSGTATNSQCLLNGSSSSVVVAGTQLTMTVSLQFTNAFALSAAGARKTLYVVPVTADGSGPANGPLSGGTYTVSATTPATSPAVAAYAPRSGQGMSQVFTLSVYNANGTSDFTSIYLLISTQTSLSKACWLTYTPSAKIFSLINDSATSYVGTLTPGQAGSISNAACTLSGAGSSVTASGNFLTLALNVQFTTAFASTGGTATKTVYAVAYTQSGTIMGGGFNPIGTWTIGASTSPDAPTITGVTPSSGQGTSQAFTLTVADTAGASDLATVQLLFSNSTSATNACSVTYIAQQGQLGLTNDAGTAYVGYVTPGQSGTVSNTQCTLNGATSSVQLAGNSLTMTASLQFAGTFGSAGSSSTKNIYANPVTKSGRGPTAGITQVGTWTIPVVVNGVPSVGTVTPSTGSGLSQSFVFTASDTIGASDLASVLMLFSTSTNLGSACAITYVAQQGALGLTNDAGTAMVGYVTPGSVNTISNSQCTLNGTGSSVRLSGNTITITVSVQFSPAFSGLGGGATKTIYMTATTSTGATPAGGITTVGSWTVPAPATPPTVTSITPTSGQGVARTFTIVVNDTAGAGDLATVRFIINTTSSLAGSCSVTYLAAQNTFGLTNDAGAAYAGYATPGSSSAIANSQCTLNGASSTVVSSGTSLTLTVSLTFTQAFAALGGSATKNLYVYPVNAAGTGATAGYTVLGTWTIPASTGSAIPSPVSLTPTSGGGMTQTFSLVIQDTAGASDIQSVYFLLTTSSSLVRACWVTYTASQGVFGLINDTGSLNVGYVTPGQTGSVSNSQCTLDGATSSVQASGNYLTLNMSLSFRPTFGVDSGNATKLVYAIPYNLAGKGPSALVLMGIWTVR